MIRDPSQDWASIQICSAQVGVINRFLNKVACARLKKTGAEAPALEHAFIPAGVELRQDDRIDDVDHTVARFDIGGDDIGAVDLDAAVDDFDVDIRALHGRGRIETDDI